MNSPEDIRISKAITRYHERLIWIRLRNIEAQRSAVRAAKRRAGPK